MLEASGIHSAPRQCVARRVAQHVHMYRKRELRGFACPLDHAPDAHTTKRLAALVDEDVARFDPLGDIGPPEVTQGLVFVPLEIGCCRCCLSAGGRRSCACRDRYRPSGDHRPPTPGAHADRSVSRSANRGAPAGCASGLPKACRPRPQSDALEPGIPCSFCAPL
jgi:hypothetical protein